MEGEDRHTFTVPRALSRPVTLLGVESKLLVITMLIPLILLYTGQWVYGLSGGALMYILGRLMTSSDHQFMAVLAAAGRLDKKVFLPELFDDRSRDLAFEIAAGE